MPAIAQIHVGMTWLLKHTLPIVDWPETKPLQPLTYPIQ